MHCPVKEREPDGGSNFRFAGDSVNDVYLFVWKQASVATTASHTAKVSGLKYSLEQDEEELGRVKKQLEDKQGMSVPCAKLSTN